MNLFYRIVFICFSSLVYCKPFSPEINRQLNDVLSEQMVFDDTSLNTVSNDWEPITKRWRWKCEMEEEKVKFKVMEILKKFVPNLLRLKPIERKDGLKVRLSNGKLTIDKDFKIIGQPVCQELNEQKLKYDIIVSFKDLVGVYDWKVTNLFRRDFEETAIITIQDIRIQFGITEHINGDFELNDVNVMKINGFKVDVNIPEKITGIRFLKKIIEFMVSRISTLVAKSYLNSIKTNLQDILSEEIRDKINFKLVKEKLVFK